MLAYGSMPFGVIDAANLRSWIKFARCNGPPAIGAATVDPSLARSSFIPY